MRAQCQRDTNEISLKTESWIRKMKSEHKLSLCGGAVTEVRAGNLQSQIGSGFRNMQ